MKSGYLYVLVHSSDASLYKIGVTVLDPRERLRQHNTQPDTYAGQVVQDTGLHWEIKTYIAVPDPYYAEKAFWAATSIQDIPYRNGVEVVRMPWDEVLRGLEAAKEAGHRPPRAQPRRNKDWMLATLDGTGIRMLSSYRGLVTAVLFECRQGHVFKESPGMLANKLSCPCCVDWGFGSGYREGVRPTLVKDAVPRSEA